MRKLYKEFEIAKGGGTITIASGDINSSYLIAGSDVTLTSNLTITVDSNHKGNEIRIFWNQKVTRDSSTVTILGKTVEQAILEDMLIICSYNGTDWNVWVIEDINVSNLQSSPPDTANFIQISDGLGGFSHIDGYTLSATDGLVFGTGNTITAPSFIGGNNNTGTQGFIFGSDNTFNVSNSVRLLVGCNNTVLGDECIVLASDSYANSQKETVIGHFSEDIAGTADSWVSSDILFQIANGTSNVARNSTLKMLKDGKTTVDALWTFEAGVSIPQNIIEVGASTYAYNPTVDYPEVILNVTYTATGAVAITLDASVLAKNTKIIIKDTGGNASANNITITPDSGTIDGAANIVLSTDYESITLFTDGVNFFVI